MTTDPVVTGPLNPDEDAATILHKHREWVHQRPSRVPRLDPTHPVVIRAAVDAAHHLFDAGYPPLFDMPTIRAVYRAGHRALACHLYEHATGEVVE